jgi:hypothetical protein
MQPNDGDAGRADTDGLSSVEPIVLVVSLAVARGGQVVHGEVYEPESGRTGRFVGLEGLSAVLRRWLRPGDASPPYAGRPAVDER